MESHFRDQSGPTVQAPQQHIFTHLHPVSDGDVDRGKAVDSAAFVDQPAHVRLRTGQLKTAASDIGDGAAAAGQSEALTSAASRHDHVDPNPSTSLQPPQASRTGSQQVAPALSSVRPGGCAASPKWALEQEDNNTPDAWVHRSAALIRLTGRHPFNAEPHLSDLMAAGFFTPSHLHFVRNHGAVPKLEWGTHRLEVKGLLNQSQQQQHSRDAAPSVGGDSDTASSVGIRSFTFSMDDLVRGNRFEIIELPVTISCDGNRRKELNMLRRTRGFNWGPGATACSIWRGIRACDLINAGCGGVSRDARYVYFTGADELTGGHYEMQLPIATVMDPSNDIILAFAMNGERLPPDHGFPLRLVVPGNVGGRMVKWLTTITISNAETRNHWQWHDHKVLPAQVADTAGAKEGHWYNREYEIYEHNVNSVVSAPAHAERVQLASASTAERDANLASQARGIVAERRRQPVQDAYLLSGYAFSGGGRRVTRVEVSLDNGQSWHLANREYPIHPSSGIPRHDRHYWTWCHWHLPVHLQQLVQAEGIMCRAWDSSVNTQPMDRLWNVTGMMNNSVYSVHAKIDRRGLSSQSRTAAAAADGGNTIVTFVHPVVPGLGSGGWMGDDVHEHGWRPPWKVVPFVPQVADAGAEGSQREGSGSRGLIGAPPWAGRHTTPSIPSTVPNASAPGGTLDRLFTMKEVRAHSSIEAGGLWFAIRGSVYDLSSALRLHPGGPAALTSQAGSDVTALFESIHGEDADDMKEGFRIGSLVSSARRHGAAVVPSHPAARGVEPLSLIPASELATTTPTPAQAGIAVGISKPHELRRSVSDTSSLKQMQQGAVIRGGATGQHDQQAYPEVAPSDAAGRARTATHLWTTPAPGQPPDTALHPRRPLKLTFLRKEILSPDTRRFIFSREKRHLPFGLPVGRYVSMGASVDGRLVVRPYTPVHPIIAEEDDGEVHFVIKVYRADAHHGHGGVMSQYLDSLQAGACVTVKGPFGHVTYHGGGDFEIAGYQGYSYNVINAASSSSGAASPSGTVAAGLLKGEAGDGSSLLHADNVALVGGGTGITPLYQLLRAFRAELQLAAESAPAHAQTRQGDDDARHGQGVTGSESDTGTASRSQSVPSPPRAWLVYSNHTPSDILMRAELDEIASTTYACTLKTPASPNPEPATGFGPDEQTDDDRDRPFNIWYVVGDASHGDDTAGTRNDDGTGAPESSTSGKPWSYGVGHVDRTMLAEHLPTCLPHGADSTASTGEGVDAGGSGSGSGRGSIALVCGPPGLLEMAVLPVLEERLGYRDERLVEF